MIQVFQMISSRYFQDFTTMRRWEGLQMVLVLSEICRDFMLSQAGCLMALTTCFCPPYSSLLPFSSSLSTPPTPTPFHHVWRREQQAGEEGDQMSHAGVWRDGSRDRPLPPPSQPVRLSAQGQDPPREWVFFLFFCSVLPPFSRFECKICDEERKKRTFVLIPSKKESTRARQEFHLTCSRTFVWDLRQQGSNSCVRMSFFFSFFRSFYPFLIWDRSRLKQKELEERKLSGCGIFSELTLLFFLPLSSGHAWKCAEVSDPRLHRSGPCQQQSQHTPQVRPHVVWSVCVHAAACVYERWLLARFGLM